MNKTGKKAIIILIGVFCLAGALTFPIISEKVKAFFGKNTQETAAVEKNVPAYNYPLPSEIEAALDMAHAEAESYASEELDKWISELMAHVDEEFLNDYFNFMNVKYREVASLYHTVVHFFVEDADSAEEAARKELEEEISRKIVKPEISQERIRNITAQTIDVYLKTLDNELKELQAEYQIPNLEWKRYIEQICGITLDAETKDTPYGFKLMTVSGVTLSAMAVTPVVNNIVRKISVKIAEKNDAKAGAKIAEEAALKTGAKVAGKSAGSFAKAVPYVGMGITAVSLVWDIYDYSNSVREGKQFIKESLEEYFAEVKIELLGTTENSIMGSITAWENTLKENIKNTEIE